MYELSKDLWSWRISAFGNKTEDVTDLNRYVSNVAYFMAIGIGVVESTRHIASVLSNVTLYRRGTEKNISTIDLKVAVTAFGVIATTTLLLAILTLSMWVFLVFRRNRRHYNTFCSIHEILELSNLEKASKLTQADLQRKVIGISQNGPHLIIAEDYEMHKCEGAKWREKDIY